MSISIKINTAVMIRNRIAESIKEVEKLYRDDMYWVGVHKSLSKRRLAIENMKKFKHWIHEISDTELVKLVHKKGFMNMLDKYPKIMFYIVASENENWIWKPRYVLGLMILINYVVDDDWCEYHHTGVIARGILRSNKFIRINEYFKDINVSKTHRENIMKIYEEISRI